jgi:uncharacterized pyridoxamine 5'-phosphate oxidase family protein
MVFVFQVFLLNGEEPNTGSRRGYCMKSLYEEALGYIEPIDVSYVATCVDDQPYVRAMMLIKNRDRFYFATGSTDNKMDQLTRNPNIEVCIPIDGDEGSIRLRGLISFIKDEEIRAEIHRCAAFIQSFWEDPRDPGFVLMEFKPCHLELMRPGSVEILRSEIR